MTKAKKTKPETARELLQRIESDPEFIARRAAREGDIAERRARRRIEEEPVLAELRKVGLHIESMWDLVNTSQNYDVAVPVLLTHLQRGHPEEVRGVIARALGVPAAASAWPLLVREYRNAKAPVYRADFGVKHGLAVTLGIIATGDRVDELASFARDTANGPSRIYFLPKLRRSKRKAAQEALLDLADDPDLKKEIASWVRRKRK